MFAIFKSGRVQQKRSKANIVLLLRMPQYFYMGLMGGQRSHANQQQLPCSLDPRPSLMEGLVCDDHMG